MNVQGKMQNATKFILRMSFVKQNLNIFKILSNIPYYITLYSAFPWKIKILKFNKMYDKRYFEIAVKVWERKKTTFKNNTIC